MFRTRTRQVTLMLQKRIPVLKSRFKEGSHDRSRSARCAAIPEILSESQPSGTATRSRSAASPLLPKVDFGDLSLLGSESSFVLASPDRSIDNRLAVAACPAKRKNEKLVKDITLPALQNVKDATLRALQQTRAGLRDMPTLADISAGKPPATGEHRDFASGTQADDQLLRLAKQRSM